jgi:hypothetical protein
MAITVLGTLVEIRNFVEVGSFSTETLSTTWRSVLFHPKCHSSAIYAEGFFKFGEIVAGVTHIRCGEQKLKSAVDILPCVLTRRPAWFRTSISEFQRKTNSVVYSPPRY